MRLAVRLFSSVTLACASPALACSVSDDYRVPTNLELLAEADLVMIARVDSGSSAIGLDAEMTVTPLEVLKGNVPIGKPMQVPGSIAEPRFSLLSNPLELEQAHPLAYIGGCTRYMFVQGSTVLFVLQSAEKAYDGKAPPELQGKLLPGGGPFSRWAEDVLIPNSPWPRAARIYLEVAGLPKAQQVAALRSERDALLRAGNQSSAVIAEDIDRQLAGPNKPWNERMMEEVEKMRARGEDPVEAAAKAIEDAAEALNRAADDEENE